MIGVRVQLAWPSPKLSPNTGAHFYTKHRFKKAAKTTAYWVTKEALGCNEFEGDGEFAVAITAHPIKGKVRPDADNLIASCKAFLDGIALAIGVDDKHFQAPTVTWGEPVPHGKLVIEVGS